MDWRTQFSRKMEKTALRKSEANAWMARFPYYSTICLSLTRHQLLSCFSSLGHRNNLLLPQSHLALRQQELDDRDHNISLKEAHLSRQARSLCMSSALSALPRLIYPLHLHPHAPLVTDPSHHLRHCGRDPAPSPSNPSLPPRGAKVAAPPPPAAPGSSRRSTPHAAPTSSSARTSLPSAGGPRSSTPSSPTSIARPARERERMAGGRSGRERECRAA
jgi:hypothetical protein